MDNDPVNKSNEEEYKFIDTEHTTEFSSPSSKRAPMPTRENTSGGRKNIFIVIGIVAAVFCLYKLYGVFSATPEKPKSEMPVPTVAAKVPAVVVAPPKPPVSEEVSSMQDKVGTLERVVSQVSQSNANLQDQMAGVSTAIADIQNSISSLSQQISVLTKPKPVEVVKTPIKNKGTHIKSKSKAKSMVNSKMKATTVMSKRAGYYIRAMIQGRAWLMTPEGATLTVSEGDNLPGYGQIVSIDPHKGEITTSSGAVITFRSDDK